MTDTHPHHIFVYGTLKTGHGNNGLLKRHESIFIGPATTVDKFVLNDGFPYVYRPPNKDNKGILKYLGHVRGELWRVTHKGLDATDALEGHPTSYCRTDINVGWDNNGHTEVVTAGIYLMRWSRFLEPQTPDEGGFLEWGRNYPRQARDFQRRSGE